jgi:hypothetical protein
MQAFVSDFLRWRSLGDPLKKKGPPLSGAVLFHRTKPPRQHTRASDQEHDQVKPRQDEIERVPLSARRKGLSSSDAPSPPAKNVQVQPRRISRMSATMVASNSTEQVAMATAEIKRLLLSIAIAIGAIKKTSPAVLA